MAGRMTRREEMAKEQIFLILNQQGYRTYASLFNLFDLFLTKDPNVAAYMIPSQAKIVINDGLDTRSDPRNGIRQSISKFARKRLTKFS